MRGTGGRMTENGRLNGPSGLQRQNESYNTIQTLPGLKPKAVIPSRIDKRSISISAGVVMHLWKTCLHCEHAVMFVKAIYVI